MTERLSTWESLKHAVRSKRLAVVTLLMFSSGLPLGLVWIAIPVWLKDIGIDIRAIGLLTLFQAPWSFKFLWSPLMDRYEIPILGKHRGYTLISQIGLFLTGLALTFVSDHPERFSVIASLCLAIALISATQDIAIDAYTVEVLRGGRARDRGRRANGDVPDRHEPLGRARHFARRRIRLDSSQRAAGVLLPALSPHHFVGG